VQRRAASAGRWQAAGDDLGRQGARRRDQEAGPDAPRSTHAEESFRALGDELFAVVDRARKQRVDPELALRAAADRFRDRMGGQ
jgi:hypothetical protein